MDGDRDRLSTTHWNGMPLLAIGMNRICVLDPLSSAHCLKFERPASQRAGASLRRRLRLWRSRLDARLGDNGTELRAMALLDAAPGGATAPFARSLDRVATPWGPALRCECVRLPDGSPALSLHAHLYTVRRYPAHVLYNAVDRFEAWLLASGLPLFDLNPGNFVVVPCDTGVRLVCVDAKSLVRGKELIPLSRWSPALRRRKIKRRLARLRARIARASCPPATALHCSQV